MTEGGEPLAKASARGGRLSGRRTDELANMKARKSGDSE